MIEARHISVTLGGKRILSEVSIRAAAGAVTAIIGPNGSGKTTLLKALSGELSYTGEATINGRSLERMKPWEAASLRGVLPQATSLAFPYTVREIVALGELGSRTAGERCLPEQALARVDLDGYAGRFYQELSGGEQQRVQLARVLCQIREPVRDGAARYLLLDEPVSSLDLKHQLAIMRIARDFADGGGGVLAILHDLNLTAMFADHVIAMRHGRVAAAGSPREVLSDDILSLVYDCGISVGAVPEPHVPFVLPQAAGSSRARPG